MGLSGDFIAARAQAVTARTDADARWAAFREAQEPRLRPLIDAALNEAVRGLSGAGVATHILRVMGGTVAQDHRAWRLRTTHHTLWSWITTEAKVFSADFRQVQRQGDDVWIVNDENLRPEGLPPSAFVVTKAGTLVAHLVSSEGQLSWRPFEEWVLEQMTAIAEPTRIAGDSFPGPITEQNRQSAYDWASAGKWQLRSLR